MKVDSFLILGSDKKMIACRDRLRERDFRADVFDRKSSIENIKCYNYLILPLPTIANSKINGTSISLTELISELDENQKVFCGNLKTDLYKNFYSYYYDESFLINNSRLTAQGVLRLITENIEKDYKNSKVLVIGYGRCGKSVCKLLKNCGMQTTSVSRKRDTKTLAENDGILVEDLNNLNQIISDFDIIINTVPVNIINREGISKLSQKNIYIEIASKPYGFDISEYDVFNFKYILGESLPGRFTPVTAGYNIADTVLNILKEEEYG